MAAMLVAAATDTGASRPIAVIAGLPQNGLIPDAIAVIGRHRVSKSRWNVVGWVIFCIVGLVGFTGLMLRAAKMVLEGRGAETYRTFWLVEFNWIGVLITAAAGLLALAAALAFQWREDWKWRELERRYGTRDPSL